MRGVARVTSEELATQARAFWFDPERRRGYWNGDDEAAAIRRAGGTDDGLERVKGGGQAERLRLKDSGGTAAVVTRERLACLGARWKGGRHGDDAPGGRGGVASVPAGGAPKKGAMQGAAARYVAARRGGER